MAVVYGPFKRGRPIPEHYQDPYVAMENDRLVVTPLGCAALGPYARRLGIDLKSIHCFDQYLEVREKLAPLFWERMADQLQAAPETLELKALWAIVEGDYEKLERLKTLLLRMRKHRISVGSLPGETL